MSKWLKKIISRFSRVWVMSCPLSLWRPRKAILLLMLILLDRGLRLVLMTFLLNLKAKRRKTHLLMLTHLVKAHLPTPNLINNPKNHQLKNQHFKKLKLYERNLLQLL